MPGERLWTKQEDQLLRDSYAKATSSEMARHLGRTTGAVTNRLEVLGLNVAKRELMKTKAKKKRVKNPLFCWRHKAAVLRKRKEQTV